MNVGKLFGFGKTRDIKSPIPRKQAGKEKGIKEPADGFTSIGEMDRQLSQGKMPPSLELEAGTGKAAKAKRRYKIGLVTETIADSVFGGGIFYLLAGSTLPVIGPAVGVGLGIITAVDNQQSKNKGKVEIQLDDKKQVKNYYISPGNYEKSPEEMKAMLTAQGRLGDKISLPGDQPDISREKMDPEKLNALKPYAGTLKSLGKARRLVAPMGQKSRYGKDALNIVDPKMARDLIAAGKPVYVVNGKKSSEVPHYYRTTAFNKDHTVLVQEAHDYVEKKLDYSLTQIKNPVDLAQVEKKAEGLPEGMLGVYKDEDSYSEVVTNQSKEGYGKYENTFNHRSEDIKYYGRSRTRQEESGIKKSSDVMPRATLPPYIARVGALIGLGVGAVLGAMIPVPGLNVVTTGVMAYAGHRIGKKLSRPVFTKQTLSQTNSFEDDLNLSVEEYMEKRGL